MQDVKERKVKPLTPEERDKLARKYEIGKYRPYEIDWERAKQLVKDTREELSIKFSEVRKSVNKNREYKSYGSGKKQKETELQRLKLEIENG
jgi:hypothetical protein